MIGPGQEATLVSPVNIQCEKLMISTGKVVVEPGTDPQTAAVALYADRFDGHVTSVPVCRGGVKLSCAWGALVYPWNQFAAAPGLPRDPGVEEALRRFRKFVIAFRSHGKGSLARYEEKLEHARMTKGYGKQVLDAMVKDGILTKEDRFYFLDSSKLAELKVSYQACMAGRFSSEAVAFVERAVRTP